MALQVWLPLNGNLKNKGCTDVTITNKGATIDENGKIGKCYSISEDGNGIILNNYMQTLKTYETYTMSAWIYMDSEATSHSTTILSSGNWNTTDGSIVFGLGVNYNNGYGSILIPNQNIWSVRIILSEKLVIGQWYHILITWDGDKTRAYINGKYVGSVSDGGICQNSESNNLKIGAATYTNGFTLHGKINDIRIYDHCLSEVEIKEVARGLILHYKLDNIENNIITDSSGYGNHGTIVGTATLESNSCRYSNAVHMNNYRTTNRIETSSINCADDIFSVSFWLKSANLTSKVFFADPKIRIGFLSNLIYVSPNSHSGFTIDNFKLDEWNHIVAIRNGSEYSLYINGVKKTSSGKNNYYFHNIDKLWILNRSQNTEYGSNASMSDLRIYSTILSEEDIRQLYEVSAKIDNSSNLYSNELVEYSEGKELLVRNFASSYRMSDNWAYWKTTSDGFIFNDKSSTRTDYIEVNSELNDYFLTVTYSASKENLFYIGFERFDENKTTRPNEACYYVVEGKTTNDVIKKKLNLKLTQAFSTDTVNPCKYIRLRVLNGWTGTENPSEAWAIIYNISLREVPKDITSINTKILSTSIFKTDLLAENNNAVEMSMRFNTNVNEFIEK